MPRYRLKLPVRAIGRYRLPDGELAAGGVKLTAGTEPAYSVQVEVQGDTAEQAYQVAQERADHLFAYLALLGDGAAFLLDGREGVSACNLDLRDSPVPADQPAPPFESIGGGVGPGGQEYFGRQFDPDGNKRRQGGVLLHSVRAVIVPGHEVIGELKELFEIADKAPPRLRVALDVLHGAACAREPSSSFAQTHTALEVMCSECREPTVLDAFFAEAERQLTIGNLPFQSKRQLLNELRNVFTRATLAAEQVDRLINYVSSTASKSQVDVIRDYLARLGIEVQRATIIRWKEIRGGLVHAAEATEADLQVMTDFKRTVRDAMLEELRRTK